MTLGLAIGALFIGEAIPSVVLPVYITLNMLVCGFFVREETIPVIWKWLYDISFMQWIFSALCINQFQHQEYNQICEGACSPPCRTSEGRAGRHERRRPVRSTRTALRMRSTPNLSPQRPHRLCSFVRRGTPRNKLAASPGDEETQPSGDRIRDTND